MSSHWQTDQLGFRNINNKDVVRRILADGYHPPIDGSGPSWLTFIGQAKDSLHSIDLFRCESVALRTYWVLVVMDQYTRRIIGFGVHRGIVDGVGLCRMFKRAIRWQTVPKYLSSDHDPLYRFHRWQGRIFGCSSSLRSKLCLTCRCHIRSSSDLLGPFVEST